MRDTAWSVVDAALGVWLLSLARREWRGDPSGRNRWRIARRTALGLLFLLKAAMEAARAMRLNERAWDRFILIVGLLAAMLLVVYLVALVGSMITSRRR